MFQMNANQVSNRYVQFDGLVHYYKRGWLSNKWQIVYVKLWSDSQMEWFQSKVSFLLFIVFTLIFHVSG